MKKARGKRHEAKPRDNENKEIENKIQEKAERYISGRSQSDSTQSGCQVKPEIERTCCQAG